MDDVRDPELVRLKLGVLGTISLCVVPFKGGRAPRITAVGGFHCTAQLRDSCFQQRGEVRVVKVMGTRLVSRGRLATSCTSLNGIHWFALIASRYYFPY